MKKNQRFVNFSQNVGLAAVGIAPADSNTVACYGRTVVDRFSLHASGLRYRRRPYGRSVKAELA